MKTKRFRITPLLAYFALLFMGFAVTCPQTNAEELSLRNVRTYIFESGDHLRITVEGETELSRDYKIDADGSIHFPLIGAVHVAGQNTAQIEDALTQKLKDGYLRNPVIDVNAIDPRAITVIGEIKNPGQYLLLQNIKTLSNAIALAGGYTEKSDQDNIGIIRASGNKGLHKTQSKPSTKVQSGDVIIVHTQQKNKDEMRP